MKEKRVLERKCTAMVHGGVYRHISTPRKSGNKMKRKKIACHFITVFAVFTNSPLLDR